MRKKAEDLLDWNSQTPEQLLLRWVNHRLNVSRSKELTQDHQRFSISNFGEDLKVAFGLVNLLQFVCFFLYVPRSLLIGPINSLSVN